MVRAHSVLWQSGLVERFDTLIGNNQNDDRFVGMTYDTLRHSYIDSNARDEIRANRAAARRMLIRLNRAEPFAERCEELSAGPVHQGFGQLQVDVLSAARFRQLRERYERVSGGIVVEQRHEIRELLEQAKRTGDLAVDDILASVRCSHRKWLSASSSADS
jgi:hypothetical protein